MRIATILLTLSFAASAWGRCAEKHIFFWPPADAELSARPMILVTGYGEDAGTVQHMNGAYLAAGDHRVELKIVQRNEGHLRLVQAALLAQGDLKPGQTYTLWLTDAKANHTPLRTLDDGSTAKATWKVGAKPAAKVDWATPPKTKHGSLSAGRGTSLQIDAPAPRMGLVEIALEGGKTWVYQVPKEGPIEIGHPACSAGLKLSGDAEFKATLTALDGAGGRSASHTVSFKGLGEPPRIKW